MKNNAKKSIKIGRINIPLNYWTGLAVYAVILLILAICMIVYTGSCLKKYENSQSDKVMNDFLNDFTKMAADKTLADNIELPASSEFEGKDTFVNMYMSELDGTTDYTCKKSEGSYNTEEPMYDIYADDKKVARMTLEAKDQHVVLGILTVFDQSPSYILPEYYMLNISDTFSQGLLNTVCTRHFQCHLLFVKLSLNLSRAADYNE